MNTKKNTSAVIASMIILLSPGVSCYQAFAAVTVDNAIETAPPEEAAELSPTVPTIYMGAGNLNSINSAAINLAVDNNRSAEAIPTETVSAASQLASASEMAENHVNPEYLAVLLDKMHSEPNSFPSMGGSNNDENLHTVWSDGKIMIFIMKSDPDKKGELLTGVTVEVETGKILAKIHQNIDGIPSLMEENPVTFVEDEIRSEYFKDIDAAIAIYQKRSIATATPTTTAALPRNIQAAGKTAASLANQLNERKADPNTVTAAPIAPGIDVNQQYLTNLIFKMETDPNRSYLLKGSDGDGIHTVKYDKNTDTLVFTKQPAQHKMGKRLTVITVKLKTGKIISIKDTDQLGAETGLSLEAAVLFVESEINSQYSKDGRF